MKIYYLTKNFYGKNSYFFLSLLKIYERDWINRPNKLILDDEKLMQPYVDIILKDADASIKKTFSNYTIWWSGDDKKFFKELISYDKVVENDLNLYCAWKIAYEVIELVNWLEFQHGFDEDIKTGNNNNNCDNDVTDNNKSDNDTNTSDESDQEIRSLYCAGILNKHMGIIISYEIAKTKNDFHNTTEKKVLNILKEIRLAFNELVQNSNWMDTNTKHLVIDKSNAMKWSIGFPKWLQDDDQLNEYYNGLEFDENTFLENVHKIRKWEVNKKLKSISELEWEMMPTEVNAYYDYEKNHLSKINNLNRRHMI